MAEDERDTTHTLHAHKHHRIARNECISNLIKVFLKCADSDSDSVRSRHREGCLRDHLYEHVYVVRVLVRRVLVCVGLCHRQKRIASLLNPVSVPIPQFLIRVPRHRFQ